jgi:hypothetical protein
VVVEVVHLTMAVIDILVAEIMIHLDIAVVIHHDQMKGKIANQMKTISIFFYLIKIDDADILDHVVRFNRISVIIVNDQDRHHLSKILKDLKY